MGTSNSINETIRLECGRDPLKGPTHRTDGRQHATRSRRYHGAVSFGPMLSLLGNRRHSAGLRPVAGVEG